MVTLWWQNCRCPALNIIYYKKLTFYDDLRIGYNACAGQIRIANETNTNFVICRPLLSERIATFFLRYWIILMIFKGIFVMISHIYHCSLKENYSLVLFFVIYLLVIKYCFCVLILSFQLCVDCQCCGAAIFLSGSSSESPRSQSWLQLWPN